MLPNQQYPEIRTSDEDDKNRINIKKFAANAINNSSKRSFCIPQIILLQQNLNNLNILNQIQHFNMQNSNQNNNLLNTHHLMPQYQQQHKTYAVNYSRDSSESRSNFASNSDESRQKQLSSMLAAVQLGINNRKLNFKEYNEFQKAYNETKAALRIMPKYEELNYLNCPFRDISRPYQPLDYFNYALPQKVDAFQSRRLLSSEEYDQMREEFNKNGVHTNWTKEEMQIADREGLTLLPVNFLEDSHFPLLDIPSKHELSHIWTIQDEGRPLPVNINPAITVTDQGYIQKKQEKPNRKSLEDHCVFCKNNGVEQYVYMGHKLKDSSGRTVCPRLRLYTCPICGADGDKAHTTHYCPKKKIVTMEEVNAKARKHAEKKSNQFRSDNVHVNLFQF